MGGDAIRNLFVKLSLNGSEFTRGVNSAKRDLDSLSAKAAEAGRKMASVGKTMAAALTLPLAGAGAFAIKQASDLNEAVSAVEETFGSAASQVSGFSGSVAKSLGLSRSEALSASTVLGVFGKSAGLAGADLANFSNETLKAAADLGSFYNASTPEVLTAMQAALRGEFDPLERFGIMLNQASLEAYALEQGIWDGSEAMTQQQKVLATQSYVLDHMGAATDNFAKTQGGAANQMKIAQAAAKDLAAQFGQILLPYFIQALGIAQRLMERINGLSETQRRWVVIIGAAVAALGPLLFVFGKMMTLLPHVATGLRLVGLALRFIVTANPVILALVAAIGLLYLAYRKNFLGFADGVQKAWGRVSRAFDQGGVLGVLKIIPNLLYDAALGARGLLRWIGELFTRASDHAGPFASTLRSLGSVFKDLGNIAGTVGRLIQQVFQGDWSGALDSLRTLGTQLWALFESINQTLFRLLADAIGPLMMRAFQAIPWPAIGQALLTGAMSLAAQLYSLSPQWLQVGILWLAQLAAGIASGVQTVWNTLSTLVSTIVGMFQSFVESASGFYAAGVAVIGGLIRGISEKAQELWTWASGIGTRLVNAVGDTAGWLYDKGMALIRGLLRGMQAVWGALRAWWADRWDILMGWLDRLETTTLYQKGKDLLGWFWQGMKNVWGLIKTWFYGIGPGFQNAMSNAWSWLYNAGKAVIAGFWTGMYNEFQNLIGWFRAAMQELVNVVPDELKIGSPSRVMRPFGANAMGSIGLGIEDALPGVQRTFRNAIGSLTAEMGGDIPINVTRSAALAGLGDGAVGGGGGTSTHLHFAAGSIVIDGRNASDDTIIDRMFARLLAAGAVVEAGTMP